MSKKLFSAVLVSTFAICTMSSAMAADGTWAQDHPRRAEVNGRLKNQDRRIHNEVKEGEISKQQAHQLHQDDHQVRQEERDMAQQNGGHITKQEKSTLNQQENSISNQIGH